MKDIFIHATAEVDDKAVIGKGTKIWNYNNFNMIKKLKK